jgi:hypothetical protein
MPVSFLDTSEHRGISSSSTPSVGCGVLTMLNDSLNSVQTDTKEMKEPGSGHSSGDMAAKVYKIKVTYETVLTEDKLRDLINDDVDTDWDLHPVEPGVGVDAWLEANGWKDPNWPEYGFDADSSLTDLVRYVVDWNHLGFVALGINPAVENDGYEPLTPRQVNARERTVARNARAAERRKVTAAAKRAAAANGTP